MKISKTIRLFIEALPPNPEEKDIDRVFKAFLKSFHPDRHPSNVSWAQEQTKELIQAAEVLRDPIRRDEVRRILAKEHKNRERQKQQLQMIHRENTLLRQQIHQKTKVATFLGVSIFALGVALLAD